MEPAPPKPAYDDFLDAEGITGVDSPTTLGADSFGGRPDATSFAAHSFAEVDVPPPPPLLPSAAHSGAPAAAADGGVGGALTYAMPRREHGDSGEAGVWRKQALPHGGAAGALAPAETTPAPAEARIGVISGPAHEGEGGGSGGGIPPRPLPSRNQRA